MDHVRVQRLHKNNVIEVNVIVNKAGIFILMDLPVYLKHIADHIGSPLGILTQKQLESKLLAASEEVNTFMKDASIYNKPPMQETPVVPAQPAAESLASPARKKFEEGQRN
jgi:hypothetical protein